MKRVKIYSLWVSLCLCIIYISSTILSTTPYAHEKISSHQELLISDASSLGHLEELISENLFTVPSPAVEAIGKPTPPLFVKARFSADRTPLLCDLKWGKRTPTNNPTSQHISAQFEYSSQYYVFALRHIII